MKNVLRNLMLVIGVILFIGIFVPQFRVALAQLMDGILHPLLNLGKIHVVIFVLATFTALYSSVIQRFTVDHRFMVEAQRRISDFQKRYLKAMKENNQFLLKQLEKEKEEIQRIQTQLMNMNFRTMFYTVVVTIPIWVWLWYVIYNIGNVGYHGGSYYSMVSPFNVTVPFAGDIHVSDSFIVPWWLFWYFLCSIAVGQVFRRILQE